MTESPSSPSPDAKDTGAAPAEAESPAAATEAEAPKESKPTRPNEITIRGFSKVTFLWPIAALSLVFFFAGGGWWRGEGTDLTWASLDGKLGLWWLGVFTLNLVVFTFDFGRANFITFFTIIGVVVLGLVVWDQASESDIWGGIYGFFGNLHIRMNPMFYLAVFVILGTMIGLSFLRTRFDYWVLGPNELLHKHGLLGDVRGYSTLSMHVEKEIPDVFEWILFGSGRLIFKPGSTKRGAEEHLVVENVFRVNRAEKRVKDFLGTISVHERSS